MASTADQDMGAIVNLTKPKEGDNTWVAEQIDLKSTLPPKQTPDQQELDWKFGPFEIIGYFDTNTYDCGATVKVLGIRLGNVFGNLHEGVGLDVDLLMADGKIRLYLKGENEVWINLGVSITFDGTYSGDYKIASF